MFSPPNYSTPESFLSPRFGPWTVFLYLHRKPILDAVRAASPKLRGRLLDVGCGNKPYRSILLCTEHIGVDVENSPHRHENFDQIYDGNILPFAQQEFDSVLCTEVLEHSRDPRLLMREISRVLKPGGHALITAPMLIQHHEEPWDFQRFTRYGMEELARQGALDVLWIAARGGMYSSMIAMFYTALSYSLSRRPFMDVVLWAVWPFSWLLLRYERWRSLPPNISLGWQMLVQKPVPVP